MISLVLISLNEVGTEHKATWMSSELFQSNKKKAQLPRVNLQMSSNGFVHSM